MNGAGDKRYSKNWEKLSKKLRLLYPCAICGENEYSKKEVHHIDENKKNGKIENCIVLCTECHFLTHQGKQSLPKVDYSTKSKTIKFEINNNSDWINKNSKIEVIAIDSKTAMNFRKLNVKAWIKPGACNLYLGMIIDNVLRGVLGFQNPDFGNYGIVMKADTTNSNNKYSIDLLLYLLRSNEVKKIIEQKFNRNIESVYSTCFSIHNEISRYRKHGNLTKKTQTEGGFNISYTFNLGEFSSIKEAKSIFFQKHKDL